MAIPPEMKAAAVVAELEAQRARLTKIMGQLLGEVAASRSALERSRLAVDPDVSVDAELQARLDKASAALTKAHEAASALDLRIVDAKRRTTVVEVTARRARGMQTLADQLGGLEGGPLGWGPPSPSSERVLVVDLDLPDEHAGFLGQDAGEDEDEEDPADTGAPIFASPRSRPVAQPSGQQRSGQQQRSPADRQQRLEARVTESAAKAPSHDRAARGPQRRAEPQPSRRVVRSPAAVPSEQLPASAGAARAPAGGAGKLAWASLVALLFAGSALLLTYLLRYGGGV